MRYKRILSILILGLCAYTQVNAQTETSIQYVFGFPMGNLNDYSSKVSFRGVGIDFRALVTDKIAVGGDLGVNTFYERMDYGTYTDGTASLSGIQYRYTNSFPMHVTGAYYFNRDKPFSPFIGLGVGTTYTMRDTDMGLYVMTTDAWQFSLKPEVGVIRELNSSIGIKVAAKYYANFKANDLEGQSFLGLGVGLVFLH